MTTVVIGFMLCVLQVELTLQQYLTLAPSESHILEGSNITLTCSYRGFEQISYWKINDGATMVFYRNGSRCIGFPPLNNVATYHLNCFPNNTFSVTILKVTLENHSQVWTCGTKSYSSASNSVAINVTVPVKEVTIIGINQLQENSTALLTCSMSVSSTPPNVFWFQQNNVTTTEIRNGSFAVITRRESVKNGYLVQVTEQLQYTVNRSMNGWSIYCNASNWMSNQVKSNKITLNVTYPPDGPPVIHGFNNGSTYKVIETKPAKLSCSVKGGNPIGKPKLYCKDVFTDTMKEIISTDNDKVTTNLSWIALRTQGNTCICKIDNVLSTDLAYIYIDVLYSPGVPAIQLRYRNYTHYVTSEAQLIEYKPYWLSCGADGNPLPKYNWTGPQGMQTSNTNSIHLSNVLRTQNGTYTCQVRNIMTPTYGVNISGENNTSVNIDVLYRPNIALLNNHDFIEGDSFNITCKAISANPNKTDVIWTRDKHDWNKTSHVLKLQNIARHDSMNYTCTMKNKMTPTVGREEEGSDSDTFYLNVWYKSTVKEFVVKGHERENPVVANQSTWIQFTCEMDSNPNSTGSINSPNGTTLGVSKTSYLLSSCLDSGKYSCSGSNEYNYGQQTRADINLLVNCKPISYNRVLEDIRSEWYVPVTLQFTAIAYPDPEFTWEMWTNSSWGEITNNDIISISSLGIQSNLTVNNFTSTEVNYFRLVIKNFIGDLTQNYTIQPFDRPNQPMELYSIQYLLTDTSITLTWKPGFNGGTPQNFSIQFKSEKSQNMESIVLQDTGEAMMKLTIDRLTSSTYYEFEIVAMNIKGNSTTVLLRIQTNAAVETTEDAIGGLVAGSISGAIVFTGLVVFGMLLYRKRQTGKMGGKNESTILHEGVSQMKTLAEEHIPYTTGMVYEDLRQNRDRGIIEMMENTYEQLRREKGTTAEEMKTEIEEVKEENDGVGSSNPIYTNLKLDVM